MVDESWWWVYVCVSEQHDAGVCAYVCVCVGVCVCVLLCASCVCGSSCRGVKGLVSAAVDTSGHQRSRWGGGRVWWRAMGDGGGGRGGVSGTREAEVVVVCMTVVPRLMSWYAGCGWRRGAGGRDGAG